MGVGTNSFSRVRVLLETMRYHCQCQFAPGVPTIPSRNGPLNLLPPPSPSALVGPRSPPSPPSQGPHTPTRRPNGESTDYDYTTGAKRVANVMFHDESTSTAAPSAFSSKLREPKVTKDYTRTCLHVQEG